MALPSSLEQEQLELLNRMRLNPQQELDILVDIVGSSVISDDASIQAALDYYNVDGAVLASQWATLVAAQPLAWSGQLADAADGHNAEMVRQDKQSHQLPGELSMSGRANAVGWRPTSGSWLLGENVYAFSRSIEYGHAAFAIDWGVSASGIQAGAGHRANMMNGTFREVGISVLQENNPATSVGPYLITQDFGYRAIAGNPYVLGVAFHDANGDGWYQAGEGRSGISIAVGTASTSTWESGGYQYQHAGAAITVTFSGGDLAAPVSATLDASSQNIKLDLVDDTLRSSGSITLGAGAGNLELLGVASIRATGNEAANRIDGNAGANEIAGRGGDDTLYGGDGADLIDAGTGNDSAFGGAGDDSLEMGLGDDTVWGGDGADQLFADEGRDVSYGGDGGDIILSENGDDRQFGDEGADYISGGDGNDLIDGMLGSDWLKGEAGTDSMDGGDGNDMLEGGSGADWMSGGVGDDGMLGEEGNDTLYGGAGIDWIDADGGDDIVDGGSGNDFLGGGTGSDTLRGGAGDDIFGDAADGAADTIVLARGDNGNDSILQFEDGLDRLQLTGFGIQSYAGFLSAGGFVNDPIVSGDGSRMVQVGMAIPGQGVSLQATVLLDAGETLEATDFIFG